MNLDAISDVKNLLLIDDDRLVLVTLARGLAEHGYRVQTAESVDEAEMVLAGRDKIDLAIIDINMPGRSGLELAERLREFNHVPFIFLSAFSDPHFVDKASAYGALSYLVKPIDPVQLGTVIKSALSCSTELRKLRSTTFDLQAALDKDRDVNVAIGITMMKNNLSRQSAFDLIRKTARSRRCKLDVLAKEILAQAESGCADQRFI